MKLKNIVLFIVLIGVSSCGSNKKFMSHKSMKDSSIVGKYPKTFRNDSINNDFFGSIINDPYRWLEDDNAENTKDWVNRQSEFTNRYLSAIPFRDSIRQRLSDLVDYAKFGSPYLVKNKLYMFKNSGLQNQSVFYEIDSFGKSIKKILDPNDLSSDGTKALGGISFDKSGKYLGYLVSESGADWKTAYILDLEKGQLLKDSVKWIKFSGMSWYKDGFFYSRYPNFENEKLSNKNENHRLFYHKLGTKQDQDKIWYQDTEHPSRNIYAQTSEDNRYLLLTQVESTSGNSFSFIDLEKKPIREYQLISDFDSDFNFIDNIGNNFLISTNRGAPNKKIIKIDVDKPNENNWKVLVPESEDPIKGVSIIGKYLFVTYLHNASSLVKIFDLDGEFIQNFELPAIGSISGFSSEKNSEIAYYSFSSFLFPSTIYSFNYKDLKSKVFKSPNIDFNPDNYLTKQIWYKSNDGTKVPMFITHKKDLKLNKKNPTLLYGYGGFDISISPSFSTSRLLFLEKGGIFVIANIRGGGEFGEEWHKGGTLENKQNVFDDFISAAEYLIENKYTSSRYLAIEGGSNGGLLVGACITQRPELFGVAFPKVGVLDMLRYHKFTIGWAWATDYGTSDKEKDFTYLIKYSPVHNVKKLKYPSTLVFTADHDDRVVPAHSFKFISELQYNHIGKNPVLIRIGKKAGHGAGKPLNKVLDELADMYSFMFFNMGLEYK